MVEDTGAIIVSVKHPPRVRRDEFGLYQVGNPTVFTEPRFLPVGGGGGGKVAFRFQNRGVGVSPPQVGKTSGFGHGALQSIAKKGLRRGTLAPAHWI